MELKTHLIKSLAIANGIPEQTYKKLVDYSFAELLDLQSPNLTPLYNSKPDVIKEVHASILEAIAEFGRSNWTSEEVKGYLIKALSYPASRAVYFAEVYGRNKLRLEIKLGDVGTQLPHIVDVEWKIDYVVKTSTMDISEGPIFRVSLITERYDPIIDGKKREPVKFTCTSEELQDLVYKLRDAVRHCHKIGGES